MTETFDVSPASPDRTGRPIRGRLLVLAGPSGVGKSSVVAGLREALPELLFSVSATTRPARPGEVDGRDYRFVSREGFDALIERGDLLEWAEVHGGLQRSGTPREPVERALSTGRPVLVEVDLQGARSVKRVLPEAVTVFIAPPSMEELARRLTDRGTDTPEQRERRLRTAIEEMGARDEFDEVVVNDDLQAAIGRLVALVVDRDAV
ncbi:guanylate kinase [Pseudonocardia parietis]|uniref:Guanylate kinase n=1 Tax=Pseudonocardia parietis TaxID=570936 RepID=A0ABS4VXM3_9PSEU|nr:guanylate kinase [Pseudonocardia parietis]MBP2368670.1 guanylate kinase [Pseudonocardia parietis]